MVAFRVPASTTNLGHGFDCLGIALALGNTVTVEPGGTTVSAAGGDAALAAMAERVRAECAASWARPVPPFTVAVHGDVPIARGMGSSATILVGVAAACRRLCGLADDVGAVLEVAARLEGHPDNVAAACLGGATVVGEVGGRLRWARFPVPASLMAVVAIPPFEVTTSEARRILPTELPRRDAVQGLQRTALIAAALAQGDAAALRGLFDDAWHERHRAALNPGLPEARAAAAGAGAIGTILSGSGSTVLSFVERPRADAVRAAVAASYAARGVDARVIAVEFDNRGVTVV